MTKNGEDQTELVSWDIAERVADHALRLSPAPDPSLVATTRESFANATETAEKIAEEVVGFRARADGAHSKVTDRSGWVHANVASFRRLLRPFGERLAAGSKSQQRALTPMNRSVAGVEVGLLLAWMSGRVLGQYDLFSSSQDDDADAIYYVAPSIVSLERRNGFAPNEFRLWIALHEVTHRIQFTGVPWMRGYFLDLVERGTSVTNLDASTIITGLRNAAREIRQGTNPLDENGLVGLLATQGQLEMLRDARSLMSLLEGHADIVMGSGGSAVPGAARFARVLSERRKSAKGAKMLFQQVIGIEAKLRQYGEGEDFVAEVLKSAGAETFARVWESPEMLPSLEELKNPANWIERVSVTSARA